MTAARSSATMPTGSEPIRVGRVADATADRLRTRILGRAFEDGQRLPSVGDLADQFDVSVAAVREAFRILETEGLVSIHRGQHGGAVARLPNARTAAYTVALTLNSTGTDIGDVLGAQREIEAVCAALCARRPDRHRVVVPRLQELNVAARELLDGPPTEFHRTMAAYHRALAETCGNDTLALFVGIVESICFPKNEAWGEESARRDQSSTRRAKQRALADHTLVAELVAAGDDVEVARVIRDHTAGDRRSRPSRHDEAVDASSIRMIW
jgi:GntR family transcriptional repressor for pyruvate dehydrogenase complex